MCPPMVAETLQKQKSQQAAPSKAEVEELPIIFATASEVDNCDRVSGVRPLDFGCVAQQNPGLQAVKSRSEIKSEPNSKKSKYSSENQRIDELLDDFEARSCKNTVDGHEKTMLKRSPLKENSLSQKFKDKQDQENTSQIKRDNRDFSKTKSDLGSYEITQPPNKKETQNIAVSPNPESPGIRKTENELEPSDQSKTGSKKNGQLQPSNPNQKSIQQPK